MFGTRLDNDEWKLCRYSKTFIFGQKILLLSLASDFIIGIIILLIYLLFGFHTFYIIFFPLLIFPPIIGVLLSVISPWLIFTDSNFYFGEGSRVKNVIKKDDINKIYKSDQDELIIMTKRNTMYRFNINGMIGNDIDNYIMNKIIKNYQKKSIQQIVEEISEYCRQKEISLRYSQLFF